MSVTASILYNFAHCPKRVSLDAFGNQSLHDPLNPFVRLLWERGTLFEREVIVGLERPYLDLSEHKRPDRERLTLEAMQRGEPLIYSGFITSDDLEGAPDILRKEAGGYVPGDIKSGAGEEGGGDDTDGKPKLHYAVQLALYVDILERTGFSAGRRAFVWDIHGDEVTYDFLVPQGPKKSETLWDEYLSALAETRAILDRTLTPLGASASTCKLCHWHNFCTDELAKADDLTLIPFLGRSIRDSVQTSISTIAELAAIDPEGVLQNDPRP